MRIRMNFDSPDILGLLLVSSVALRPSLYRMLNIQPKFGRIAQCCRQFDCHRCP